MGRLAGFRYREIVKRLKERGLSTAISTAPGAVFADSLPQAPGGSRGMQRATSTGAKTGLLLRPPMNEEGGCILFCTDAAAIFCDDAGHDLRRNSNGEPDP